MGGNIGGCFKGFRHGVCIGEEVNKDQGDYFAYHFGTGGERGALGFRAVGKGSRLSRLHFENVSIDGVLFKGHSSNARLVEVR